ncbi:MAG: TolC family protein [Bacteroidota bacterium]|jgi:outer membrane protein TolC
MKLHLLKGLVAASVLFIGGSRAQTDSMPGKHAFTLKQAIDYARKNNVQVKNALLDIQRQQQVNREVTAMAYPHINASISTVFNPGIVTTVLPNFISPSTYQVLINEGVRNGSGTPIQMPADFGFIEAQFGTRYSANAAVSLNQILFDGQVFVGLLARKATIEFATQNAAVTEEMIVANVAKVYYQLVVSRTQVELIDSNLALLEKNLRDTRILYENGFREKLDVDKTEVQLSNLRTERNKVMNQVSNGYYGLKLLMGMPVADELILTDRLAESFVLDGALQAEAYKYEERKDYQYAQIGKRLNEYNLRRYKLSQIPTFSMSAVYAKNAQRSTWNFLGRGDWFTISNINLNLAVPIFNGFVTKSRIQQSRIDLRKTENQIDALKNSIDREVASAKNNFTSALERLNVQRRNQSLAEQVYQNTKKKYEIGTGSQIEINVAQTDLKAAQTNYITALYDAVISKIDYLQATGKLSQTF